MRLSAIIPTHNRPTELRRCLESLEKQTSGGSEIEVIVIDDGSDTDIGSVVAELTTMGPVAMRCERQPLTGLNSARNRGVAAASGDLLAFLDDDTLVSPGWAQAMLDTFDRYPCAAVGGRVQLGLPGPAPPWLAHREAYLAEYDLGTEGRWLDEDPVPVGANCAVRRVDLERVGGFRPGLDRLAGSLISNGDTEFFRRLRASGARLRYDPAASVIHCVPAERLKVSFFSRRHFAQGMSDELLRGLDGNPVTWRHRIRLIQGMIDGGRVVGRDVIRGQGTLNGRWEMLYWMGRFKASLKLNDGLLQVAKDGQQNQDLNDQGP